MPNSIRFTKCSRVPGIALAVLALSIGKPDIAHAEHAASPNESAAAVVLNCVETWLDRPADFIAAVECMYRAWQIASCNHSRILTASLIKNVVRDIIMHVLVWMWEFGIPDARPETLRYAELNSLHERGETHGKSPLTDIVDRRLSRPPHGGLLLRRTVRLVTSLSLSCATPHTATYRSASLPTCRSSARVYRRVLWNRYPWL
jgi:hypothetical protein